MSEIKIEEIQLIETKYKTTRKFAKVGFMRLKNNIFLIANKNGYDALKQICEQIDCNFNEVLDAVNRTVR